MQTLRLALSLAVQVLPLILQIVDRISTDRADQKRLLRQAAPAIASVLSAQQAQVADALRQKV